MKFSEQSHTVLTRTFEFGENEIQTLLVDALSLPKNTQIEFICHRDFFEGCQIRLEVRADHPGVADKEIKSAADIRAFLASMVVTKL
jgi:hypothetical protein